MKLWGHGYWEVIAQQTTELAWPTEQSPKVVSTHIMQRCRHCGKIRIVNFPGNWSDYADGIYEDRGER